MAPLSIAPKIGYSPAAKGFYEKPFVRARVHSRIEASLNFFSFAFDI
ncbi:hypothetical protein [Stenotrophomonas humi]|nr:hypothetical protein [Stenotrophomonas humi]